MMPDTTPGTAKHAEAVRRYWANQQVHAFGRADQSMKSHGGSADDDILKALLLELMQQCQKFVPVHAAILSCEKGDAPRI